MVFGILASGPWLLLSCKEGEKTSTPSEAPPSEAGTETTGNQASRTPAEIDAAAESIKANNLPLCYGRGKRVIAEDSKDFETIMKAVKSIEDGDLQEVLFAVELEKGGIEVQTRRNGSSYGWTLLVEIGPDGGVKVIKKGVWRT